MESYLKKLNTMSKKKNDEISPTHDEYRRLYHQYTQQYGPNTIVLMQVGDFYEMYESRVPGYEYGNSKAMQDVVLQVEDKHYTIRLHRSNLAHTLKNPYVFGFKTIMLQKWNEKLAQTGYNFIIVDQKKALEPNGYIKTSRYVSKIILAHSKLDLEQSQRNEEISTEIVAFIIDMQKRTIKIENSLVMCGYARLNLITGEVIIGEAASKLEQPEYPLDLLEKMISTKPKEILIVCSDEKYYQHLYKKLGLRLYKGRILKKEINREYFRAPYQLQFLSKLFTIDEFKLNDYVYYLIATASLILLLQYASEIDPHIISKLTKPRLDIETSKYLFISKNTIIQLNLYSNYFLDINKEYRRIDSVISILNLTKSCLGKQYLYRRFERPYTEPAKIERCYDLIAQLRPQKELLVSLRVILAKINNINIIHRRMVLATIKPEELLKLSRNYNLIAELMDLLKNNKIEPFFQLSLDLYELFLNYKKLLNTILVKNVACNIIIEENYIDSEDPFLCLDNNTIIDESLRHKFEAAIKKWKIFYPKVRQLKELIENKLQKSVEIKFEPSRGGRYYILVCKKDSEILKSEFEIKNYGKAKYIVSKVDYKTEMAQAAAARTEWQQVSHQIYFRLIDHINTEYSSLFRALSKYVAKLDYFQSGASAANKYNWYRPCVDSTTNKSYLWAKNLRHPLVERIIDWEYVPNDIFLGSNASSFKISNLNNKSKYFLSKACGMLLYGCNSTGKTTLAKAVGISIIMAQAGYYVPASQFIYHPYEYLISRLSGNDNLFKSESSFVVELNESKTIWNNLGPKTIVLADELYRGTVVDQAAKLSINLISKLIQNETTFIISSHIHYLSEMSDVLKWVKHKQLEIKHLIFERDLNNSLKYIRKLRDGSGPKDYAILVAESVGMPTDFIESYHNISSRLDQEIELLATKRSRYHSGLYMHECWVCGSKKNLETHHLRPQRDANELNYIEHVPRDAKCNLSALCRRCHDLMEKGYSISKVGKRFELMKLK